MISIGTITELQFFMLKEAALSRAIAEAEKGMTFSLVTVGNSLPVCFLGADDMLPFLKELQFATACRVEGLKKDLVLQGG